MDGKFSRISFNMDVYEKGASNIADPLSVYLKLTKQAASKLTLNLPETE
jgi:hypothetical protein